jgi:Fic family protein
MCCRRPLRRWPSTGPWPSDTPQPELDWRQSAWQWRLLDQPILYTSVALKRRQSEYYARLSAVRTDGDWEGWTTFFLECVGDAADDGVRIAQALHALIGHDRSRLVGHERATVAAIQLFDRLPANPVVTVPRASSLLGITAPPARKTIDLLEELGVLRETTGKQRDRVYAYHAYLDLLTEP